MHRSWIFNNLVQWDNVFNGQKANDAPFQEIWLSILEDFLKKMNVMLQGTCKSIKKQNKHCSISSIYIYMGYLNKYPLQKTKTRLFKWTLKNWKNPGERFKQGNDNEEVDYIFLSSAFGQGTCHLLLHSSYFGFTRTNFRWKNNQHSDKI